ncbi:cupin domain-containing protein [Janthinobacterium sp. PAMC25594]|uniref:cupin domain-containing protein n=1 Tax=Janthinobacterium sp. PAMC25594 TaxID=2861284 RepID=UPI001C627956|nr:cupin domain-containing protein [Janthinobacterium sp. PAMC25594]QYG06806.1 cupin domain-containing protein [Janthinobacterium sp. PAMC25594]
MLNFGMTKDIFFSDFYEKKPFIKRGGYISKSIGWDEVDKCLYIAESIGANLRVHKNGFVEDSAYMEVCSELGSVKNKLIKINLAQLLGAGASIIYNRMEISSLEIRSLCNQVSRFSGAEAVANGYISFGDKETFGNHWDTHDVFAVQLLGRKRWLVYEPTFPLPLPGQTSLNCKGDCPSEPVIDEILEAGDILYIPRGWWHTAVPLDEETFHVAIGTHPPKIIDYINWISKNSLPDLLSCRTSIRLDDFSADSMKNVVGDLVSLMLDASNIRNFQESAVRNERFSSDFDISRNFRKNSLSEVNNGIYSLNSKFRGNLIKSAATVNGVFVKQEPLVKSIIEMLADSEGSISFDNFCLSNEKYSKQEVRIAIDDLLHRDIVQKVN